MQRVAGVYLGLATSVARETSDAGFGECIGAVVAGHDGSEDSSVIAVAGDARWHNMDGCREQGKGNPMAHAAMRAIGMVAQKRHALSTAGDAQQSYFGDVPLTRLESTVSAESLTDSGGYLCLDLDLFLTHEPCVMCSMAILHSRFRRVVFAQRMIHTGALSAEHGQETAMQGLGYGMFSRSSLNWKFLTWQWVDKDSQQWNVSEELMHA